MNTGKGEALFNECMAAMFYSDEEIRATMSPEDADEYIELKGGTECNLPYSCRFAKFKKSVTDENCLITVELT